MSNTASDPYSCALENLSSTQLDLSMVSDSMPSLSMDETYHDDKNSLLKDLNAKIEKLRQENFDLKIKLYLYENDAAYNDNRVIREFDKKSNEIRSLRELIDKKNVTIKDLKCRCKLDKSDKHNLLEQNEQLKAELAKANQMCVNLKEQANTNVNRLPEVNRTDSLDGTSRAKGWTKEKSNEPGYILIEPISQTISTLRHLIGEFSSNKIDYTTFLATLDSIFKTLNEQFKALEDYRLDNQCLTQSLQEAQHKLAQWNEIEARIKQELDKRVERLDLLIVKSKGQHVGG